ncbi:Cell cycle checkpoint control protein RAD9A like protein [Argiope bruennichi]|uniref:Cell cycle checkpoint control protein RAD9A like protein n=1 Tax=Argiope bruennichi TaxID=94029 RepID=A0A8T0EC81_ARGBR|nr:Cell cycle checkpoint control protein RAD9A like protein [Argiope bruennichi]
MVKIYQLHYVENETVQGSFPTSGFLCQLNASSRLLHDGIQNFSTSVEEVTLTVCSNKVLLRNYVDDEPDPNKVVHTELTLESEEFELFEVDQETKITFCLKELKAVLNFCEGFNVPVSIKCQTGGRPITFSVTGLRGVDVQFVLATLADRESQSLSSSCVSRSSVAQTSQSVKNLHTEKKRNNADTQIVLTLSSDDDDNDNNDVMLQDPIPDDDVIPSTPPHKKFRSMFLGLSQATYTTMAPDPDEVLVANSDDEHG